MTERQKPFVAWTDKAGWNGAGGRWSITPPNGDDYPHTYPVVVTPLLPDDPKPGEVWFDGMLEVTVMSAPMDREVGRQVLVGTGPGQTWLTATRHLRRPPVLKTFRLPSNVGDWRLGPCSVEVQAESKEAALAKLAESLEEVP